MTIELIYDTHSVTRDNQAGNATGWLPGELSPAGREFARELGQRRAGDKSLRSSVPIWPDPRRSCRYADQGDDGAS